MSDPISVETYAENSGQVGSTNKADKADRQEVLNCKKTFTMKNVLIAIIIGMFALMSHLTAKEVSNDLDNTPQIEIQLDRIECPSNEQLPSIFRLRLHAGGVEIYNEVIDCSVGSRTTSVQIPTGRTVIEQIPTGRTEGSNMSIADLVITIEAIDGSTGESRSVVNLEVWQTFDFDMTLYLQESDGNSSVFVQGRIGVIQ